MITVRRSADRGHFDHGWLDARHTFSFADYHDPAWMGYRSLRVINEDRIRPGKGFGTHGHRDMEIVTVVLEGALRHRDSTGGGGVVRPGEIQRMSAGTGVEHSEENDSDTAPVHLLQIWILPEARGGAPGYEQVAIPDGETRGRFRRIASRSGGPGEVRLRQDVSLHAIRLAAGEEAVHPLAPGRHAWVQVSAGEVAVNGETLRAGDGAALDGEDAVRVAAAGDSHLLLFDLA